MKKLLIICSYFFSITAYSQTMRLSEINITIEDTHPHKYVYKYQGLRGGVPPNNIMSEFAKAGFGAEIPVILADPISNLIQFDTMYYLDWRTQLNFKYTQTFNGHNQPVTRVREIHDANSATGYSPDSMYEYHYTSFGKIDTIKAFKFISGLSTECWRAIYTYDLLGRLVEVRTQKPVAQNFQTFARTSYKFSASVCIEDSTIYPNGGGINRKNVYIYKPGYLDKIISYQDYNGAWDTVSIMNRTYLANKKAIDSFWYYPGVTPLHGGYFWYGRIYKYYPDGRDDTDTCYVYDSTQSSFRRVQFTNKVTYNTQLLVTEVDARHSAGNLGVFKLLFSYEAIKDTVVEVPHVSHSIMQVDIYPSPTKGLLYVEASLPVAGTLHATITDITGRTVGQWEEQAQDSYRRQVDVQDLSQGNYFVKLSLGDQCVVKRFTKL